MLANQDEILFSTRSKKCSMFIVRQCRVGKIGQDHSDHEMHINHKPIGFQIILKKSPKLDSNNRYQTRSPSTLQRFKPKTNPNPLKQQNPATKHSRNLRNHQFHTANTDLDIPKTITLSFHTTPNQRSRDQKQPKFQNYTPENNGSEALLHETR